MAGACKRTGLRLVCPERSPENFVISGEGFVNLTLCLVRHGEHCGRTRPNLMIGREVELPGSLGLGIARASWLQFLPSMRAKLTRLTIDPQGCSISSCRSIRWE